MISYTLLCLAFFAIAVAVYPALSRHTEGSITTVFFCLMAYVIVSYTLLSLLTIEVDTFSQSVIFLIILIAAAFQLFRQQKTHVFQNYKIIHLDVVVIVPLTFLVAIIGYYILNRFASLGYLLNTWDGSSNSGLVTALRVSSDPVSYQQGSLSGWENYPRGAHVFVAWFLNAIDHNRNAIVTLSGFSGFMFFTYSLLIHQIGAITKDICQQLNADRRISLIGIIGLQLYFVSNFMTEHLLLLHSLSFITAILATLWHSYLTIRYHSHAFTNLGQFVFLTSIAILIVITTYTILLPIIAINALVILGKSIRALPSSLANHKFLYVMAFICALVSLYHLTGLIQNTDSTARYSAMGHLIPISWSTIRLSMIALVMSGLLLLIFKVKRWYLLLSPFLAAMLSQYVWIMSDNRNRSYGLNYYAKKIEYAFVVLSGPFLIAVISLSVSVVFVRLTRRLKDWKTPRLLLVPLAILTFIFVNRSIENKITPWNNQLNIALLNGALEESLYPGLSAVWPNDGTLVNTTATLMSNYLDKTVWELPRIDQRQLVIVQQMQSLYTGKSIYAMCEFLTIKNINNGVIHLVSPTRVHHC